MKPIKFRAWHREEKKWLYFVIESTKEAMEDPDCFNFFALVSSPTMHDKLENWCEYTGLKDSKNREIYEGDILKLKSGSKVVVEWKEIPASDDAGSDVVGFEDWTNISYEPEIIGDIYSNPELLK